MNMGIGILRAPRPVSTVQDTIDSLRQSFPEGTQPITVFEEPGCSPAPKRCAFISRPEVLGGEDTTFVCGPEGRMGNFQNWIQAARDLLWRHSTRDTFMLCEDDALFAPGLRPLLERDLWPSRDCGAVSLYCPNLRQYSKNNGLCKAVIKEKIVITTRNNLVGALALVFPRRVLEDLVSSEKSIAKWLGSHAQAKAKPGEVHPWERKAVDTWIGKTLAAMKKSIWHYSPSLVLHYSPTIESNSSLGHPAPQGKGSIRQCRQWIGAEEQDLCSIMPPVKERYDIVANLHPRSI